MNQITSIANVTDYILRRLDTTGSTGLYDGKAGLSLSLFITSKALQDEKIEDIAYDLIKESLVIGQNDPNFEQGTAGIGYVLLYLIENKYLDADFDDILGVQYEQLIQSFSKIEEEPSRLMNSLKAIYFLSRVAKLKKDNRAQEIIKKIFEGSELFLTIQFQDISDINYLNKKGEILKTYINYLKLIEYSSYDRFSPSLLDSYSLLYRKGKIISSLEVGYYLMLITEKYGIKGYYDVINENIINGIKNLHTYTLSLNERINSVTLIDKIKSTREAAFVDIPTPNVMCENDKIGNLLEIIDHRNNPIGYGAGLARLLIYYIDNKIELL